MGRTKDERVRGHYNISSSIMDVDLLSSSDESSSDDADIMNDVTQPHASEAKDVKEDEKTELSTNIPLLAIDPVRINKKFFDRNEHERIL